MADTCLPTPPPRGRQGDPEGPQGLTKRSQEVPRSAQRRSLGPLGPSCFQKATLQKHKVFHTFEGLRPSNVTQGPPKGPQGVPKGPHGASKGPPRGPKGTQGAPQAPLGIPGIPRGAPRGARGGPWDLPGTSRGPMGGP